MNESRITVSALEFELTAERVAALNKRAAKAGIPAVAKLVELDRRVVVTKNDLGFERTYTVIDATLTGVGDVRFNGWTLAAVIDHDVAGNITRSVPGFEVEIPAEFRVSSASRCDHCNARRNRTNTILVWSEAEGFKQVGSDCVKLFLGVSVSSLVAWIAEIESIEVEMAGDGGGSWGRHHYTVNEFVAAAALVTEVYGFAPSSFDSRSTKSLAWNLISLHGDAKGKFLAVHPELNRPDPKLVDRANVLTAEARVWVADVEASGEYMLNLKTAAARDALGSNAGLLASLPNAYKRAMGVLAERAAKATLAPSAHVGAVGDKVTTVASIVYTNRSPSFARYGPEQLFVILVGDDGNKFYVNTTVESKVGVLFDDAERGAKFTVTGVVKSHKVTDKGEAITVLTRCKAEAMEPVAA